MMCFNQCDYPSDDGGPCRCQSDAQRSMRPDLKSVVKSRFSGIGAISPETYESVLQDIAKIVGRTVDADFRSQVAALLRDMPCPLD